VLSAHAIRSTESARVLVIDSLNEYGTLRSSGSLTVCDTHPIMRLTPSLRHAHPNRITHPLRNPRNSRIRSRSAEPSFCDSLTNYGTLTKTGSLTPSETPQLLRLAHLRRTHLARNPHDTHDFAHPRRNTFLCYDSHNPTTPPSPTPTTAQPGTPQTTHPLTSPRQPPTTPQPPEQNTQTPKPTRPNPTQQTTDLRPTQPWFVVCVVGFRGFCVLGRSMVA
jgi:hypothetical protein